MGSKRQNNKTIMDSHMRHPHAQMLLSLWNIKDGSCSLLNNVVLDAPQ